MFGMSACGKVGERILWLMMVCIMESLWEVRNLWVFKKKKVLEGECIGMILSKLYVYYRRDSQGSGGTEAEDVWKYKKKKKKKGYMVARFDFSYCIQN